MVQKSMRREVKVIIHENCSSSNNQEGTVATYGHTVRLGSPWLITEVAPDQNSDQEGTSGTDE
jgi:hypothetical protein